MAGFQEYKPVAVWKLEVSSMEMFRRLKTASDKSKRTV
jgi:hypothetical protein